LFFDSTAQRQAIQITAIFSDKNKLSGSLHVPTDKNQAHQTSKSVYSFKIMFQVYSAATLAILALSHNTEAVLTAAIDKSNCEPIEKLGTSNLNRYDYSTTFDVDKDCMYTLEINMKQDESLPIPTNADQCNPAVEFPPIASDGLPYFAFRWAYESVSKKVKAATGIDHISVDFNPCGHPPMHVFTRVHYDLHIYLKDPDYRRCMTCDTITGTSVCNPTGQTTPSGRGE
jgi:hypothetical protein